MTTIPIGLRNFKGPKLLGKKLQPHRDSYYENAAIEHNKRLRPCAVKYNFSKDGAIQLAFLVTPVARCKFTFDQTGNVIKETLIIHSSTEGEPERGVVGLRANTNNGEVANIERFYGKREGGKGIWLGGVDQNIPNGPLEITLLKSHLSILQDISRDAIHEIKGLYSHLGN